MRKKITPMNSTKYGLFPLRKKHTSKTLKSDVSNLRKAGYPVKIALHTLDVTSPSSKNTKSRGLTTKAAKKYTKKKR